MKTKFLNVPLKHWQDTDNRRAFFTRFASGSGFDPLVPENWYLIQAKEVWQERGASAVLHNYQGSVPKALAQLFPDIGLVETKFTTIPKHHWNDPKNQKAFFESLARKHGIDPLVSSQWASVLKAVRKTKGLHSVLRFYQGSILKALTELFGLSFKRMRSSSQVT